MLRWIFVALMLSGCALSRQSQPDTNDSAPIKRNVVLPTDRARGSDFRVLSWNVSRENFYRQLPVFRAVLDALNADILILDEMPVAADASALAAALEGLGSVGRPWHVAYGMSGFRQRSTVASQLPVKRLTAFDHVAYSQPLVERWLADASASARGRMQANIAADMALVGALIQTDGGALITVGLDFECCGDGGDSWAEAMRRDEATQLRKALDLESSRQAADGIIVGGDFNAVNGPAPLLLVQGATDRPNRLSVAKAMQFDEVDLWTWDGRGTPFASGRLDYQMHNDRLRAVSSWVFDTADLSTEQQRQLGLEGIQMSTLSQHRPVVVDYAWTP